MHVGQNAPLASWALRARARPARAGRRGERKLIIAKLHAHDGICRRRRRQRGAVPVVVRARTHRDALEPMALRRIGVAIRHWRPAVHAARIKTIQRTWPQTGTAGCC